ncbi:MAG: RND transporter, partial [Aquabacterium sp.]
MSPPVAQAPLDRLTPAQVGLPAAGAAELPDRWWQALGDPALDDLVAHALRHQPSLVALQARLLQAQAEVAGAAADAVPQAGLAADATAQRFSG